VQAFLTLLASEPDTFIIKEHGLETAQRIVMRARDALDGKVSIETFDAEAKAIIPSLIMQGILGMALITGTSLFSVLEIKLIVTPAAIEISKCLDVIPDLIVFRAVFTSLGWTAITIISLSSTTFKLST
jgi:hypothetical protein